ncbi:MAG: hypothetical protein NZM43_02880 [Saprospiraceae bacterium]|nr:hypothetical protein [Saprospiraceae bacterium]MDW8483247.1 hypothetical protein [Saprospiraceae bacterium]
MIRQFWSAALAIFWACKGANPPEKPIAAIELFKQYITGDFDNRQQVEAERAAGKQVHPFARHINRIADHRIKNAPQRPGFWLIEESYYDMPNGTHKINHHLFFFEAVDARTVRLYAYQLPDYLPMEQLTNDNANLRIDYNDLRISPRFKPAEYTFDGKETFTIYAPNDWGNGMRFTLIEKFTPGRLEVMELLEKDGQRLTPYDSPIIYLKSK